MDAVCGPRTVREPMETVLEDPAPPQVVIALPHPVARAAVESVLASSPRVRVAAAVAGLDDAVAAVAASRASVLLIEAGLVGGDVGALARALGVAVILVGVD